MLIAFHANGDCLAGQDHAYTSWATGFVSGLAAQLRERFPKESAEQIAYRIMASADRPRMSERDDVQGWGEIRPYSALTMSLDPNRVPGRRCPGARRRRSRERPRVAGDAAGRRAATRWPPAREQALWWGLAAVGVGALALVLRPWCGRVNRRARPARGRRPQQRRDAS